MAGPQDIQRFPRGLLGLLGIQATGDTPHRLAQETNGTLEMLQFYLNDRQIFQSFAISAAPAAAGVLGFTNSAVPSGTLRFVYNAGVFAPATAAATAIKMRLAVFRGPNLNGETYVGEQLALGALDAGTIAASFDAAPMIMQPGQSFGIRTLTITGVPATAPVLGLYFADLLI